MLKVEGKCIACGRELLVVNSANRVQCLNGDCPRPMAVHWLLHAARTDHVVFVHRTHYTLEHPLIERLAEGGLSACGLCDFLEQKGLAAGTYTAAEAEGQWQLTRQK